MQQENRVVTLATGGGGQVMNKFINSIILKYFDSKELAMLRDASYINIEGDMAFCTDSFVITPEFFPGGNIGKLAVAGTVNDLACSGAVPVYLSCALVIPEGYDLTKLELIIQSIAESAKQAGVEIITGDTKVIPNNELKGLVINTSGIGKVVRKMNDYSNISEGDHIIISSDIARHGLSVFISRGELGFKGELESDCNILCKMLQSIYEFDVKFIRDATRGGIAAVLNEIAYSADKGIYINETEIPIRKDVSHLCEMLGFDPLAVANEGCTVIVVGREDSDSVLKKLRSFNTGVNASLCGVITDNKNVVIKTSIGGERYVEVPVGEILPRIC